MATLHLFWGKEAVGTWGIQWPCSVFSEVQMPIRCTTSPGDLSPLGSRGAPQCLCLERSRELSGKEGRLGEELPAICLRGACPSSFLTISSLSRNFTGKHKQVSPLPEARPTLCVHQLRSGPVTLECWPTGAGGVC